MAYRFHYSAVMFSLIGSISFNRSRLSFAMTLSSSADTNRLYPTRSAAMIVERRRFIGLVPATAGNLASNPEHFTTPVRFP
jgi:hypothetical protein